MDSANSVKKAIEALCESSEHQEDFLIGIYKLYIKDYSAIKMIHGWPVCGKEMWLWICDKFIDFDKKHHPEVWAGGIWFNNGFSSSRKVGPWEVSLEKCSFEYREG